MKEIRYPLKTKEVSSKTAATTVGRTINEFKWGSIVRGASL